MNKKNVIMDATLMSSLMGCGRYHDLRYNHQLMHTKGRSNSLEIGTLIHKVLEVFYKHVIDGFPRSVAIGNALMAGQLFVDGCAHCADESIPAPVCKHKPGEYPGLENTPEENESYKTGWKWALQSCETYFKHYENDSFIPLNAEFVDGKVLYEDDEIRVLWKAKFDLTIDTNQIGIVSMDHKTFKQKRDKTTLSNQFMGQCLILNARNVIVNKFGLQTSYTPAERFTREVVSYSADRLLEWQSEILPYYAYKYVQYDESGFWPPNFSHCDTIYGPCQFKEVCEGDRNMRQEILQRNYKKTQKWDPSND